MQVLLVENYPALGYVGDTVQVKNGYARNYLIPRGIAVDCGSRRAKEFQHLITGVKAKRTRLKSEATVLGSELAKHVLNFELKVGGGGRAFGSISSREVLKQINDLGYAFEKKQLRLSDAIKAPGSYKALVQLHAEVVAEVPVVVTGVKEAVSPKNEDQKRTKRRSRKSEEASAETAYEGTEPESVEAQGIGGERADS